MRHLNKGESFIKIEGEPAILVTKWIALKGTALITRQKKEQLKDYFYNDMLKAADGFDELTDTKTELELIDRVNPPFAMEIGDGGILAALWELGRCTGMGFEIDIRRVPVRQESIEICEYFGINPYELLSKGSFLIVTENHMKTCELFEKEGINITCIGHMTQDRNLHIKCQDRISCLNRPKPDSLSLI